MRIYLAVVVLIALSACTLNEPAPGAPTLPAVTQDSITPPPQTNPNQPTALPSVVTATPRPGALPSRTPVGFQGANPTTVNSPIAMPTSATGESATIISPAAGGSVPVGTIQVSGVVSGLQRNDFTLTLLDIDNNILNSQLITVQNPNGAHEVPWSAAMTTGSYTGPAEVRVIGAAASGGDVLLTRIPITLVSSTGGAVIAPPVQAGTGSPQAAISSPAPGGVVSGGVIQVSGTAGGLSDNQFVLLLVAPNGTVVNSQVITLTNPDYTNVVPWAAALGTNGLTGAAEIRAFSAANGSAITMTSVQVTIQ